MDRQHIGSDWKSSETRGDRAWKEATDAVTSKNEKAQKAGRLEREAYERSREEARRAAAAKRRADLLTRGTP